MEEFHYLIPGHPVESLHPSKVLLLEVGIRGLGMEFLLWYMVVLNWFSIVQHRERLVIYI
jgi:hypothetical protein